MTSDEMGHGGVFSRLATGHIFHVIVMQHFVVYRGKEIGFSPIYVQELV